MTVEINGDGLIKLNGKDAIRIGEGPFLLNEPTIDADYVIPANTNAMSAGPITVAQGVEVTVGEGSEWTVV